jgi:hypothetical protein
MAKKKAAKPQAALDMTMSAGGCSMYVKGLSIDCPRCGAHVPSGTHHTCGTVRDAAVANILVDAIKDALK